MRGSKVDLVYARAKQLEETTNVIAEARDILEGLSYYVSNELHPLITDIDFLLMKKVIEDVSEPP